MCVAVSVLGGCGTESGTSLEDIQIPITSGGEGLVSGSNLGLSGASGEGSMSDGAGQGSTNASGSGEKSRGTSGGSGEGSGGMSEGSSGGSRGMSGGSNQGSGNVPGGIGQGNDMQDSARKETDPERVAMLDAYITILEDIFFDQKFPGNQDYGYQPAQEYDVATNQFAVYDVDGDGKEELLITYSTTYTVGQGELVYGFDSVAGTITEELRAYPLLAYYDNGVVEEQMSHNHGMAPDGDFWPYILYQYDEKTDRYDVIASVDAWSRAYREEDYDGNPFPQDVDADGDGMVYYIMAGGTYDLKDPVDGAEYQRWRDSLIKGTQQLQFSYVKLTPDNIYALGSGSPDIAGGQIREQSFQVTLDGWGEVTFASFSPEYLMEKDENGVARYGDVRFMLLKDKEVVYTFPGETEDNAWPGQQFGQVLSVAFKDYDEDGRTDILLLLEYAGVQGPNTDVPFRSVRLYTQEEGSNDFRVDEPVMKYLSGNKEKMEDIYESLERYAGNYSVCTSKTAWEVDRFARKVKKLISGGDFAGISELISYPVTVDGVQYLNKESFLKADFIKNPAPEFLKSLGAESCGCMAASWRGIMMGNGAVWIGEVLDGDLNSQGLKVIGMSGVTAR